jgi:hypothetical protein
LGSCRILCGWSTSGNSRPDKHENASHTQSN